MSRAALLSPMPTACPHHRAAQQQSAREAGRRAQDRQDGVWGWPLTASSGCPSDSTRGLGPTATTTPRRHGSCWQWTGQVSRSRQVWQHPGSGSSWRSMRWRRHRHATMPSSPLADVPPVPAQQLPGPRHCGGRTPAGTATHEPQALAGQGNRYPPVLTPGDRLPSPRRPGKPEAQISST